MKSSTRPNSVSDFGFLAGGEFEHGRVAEKRAERGSLRAGKVAVGDDGNAASGAGERVDVGAGDVGEIFAETDGIAAFAELDGERVGGCRWLCGRGHAHDENRADGAGSTR